MIDYLWGGKNADPEKMQEALLWARPGLDTASITVREFRGGVLVTIGQPYPGFWPAETDDEFLLVLGGPKPAEKNDLKSQGGDNHYSHWILNRLKTASDPLAFELAGGFQLLKVNKKSGCVQVLTDAASFIPCYGTQAFRSGEGDAVALCGSHADAVARAAGVEKEIDRVSVADFLMHQTVTYPHTMYRQVHQLPPASDIRWDNEGGLKASDYWRPHEQSSDRSISHWATDLRRILVRNVAASVEGTSRVTVLMSGGEDSRVILSALPEGQEKEAVTVTDFLNHEAMVARKVSARLGAEWRLVERSPTQYLDHACNSILLGESHNFFYHAHFNGLEKDIGCRNSVLGGLMADAFTKASHMSKAKKFGLESPGDPNKWEYLGTPKAFDPGPEFKKQVYSRRQAHNESLQTIRLTNWAEWHSLYPASMNTNATNYFIDRRLFYSWEPFADSRMVLWSASVPPTWKLNRRVFHRAVKPLLKSVKWSRHAKGTFPYLNWVVNAPLAWYLGQFERVAKKIRVLLGINKQNHGPWPEWRQVVSHDAYHHLAGYEDNVEEERVKSLLGEQAFELVNRAMKDKDSVQCLSGLQIRLWAGSLK